MRPSLDEGTGVQMPFNYNIWMILNFEFQFSLGTSDCNFGKSNMIENPNRRRTEIVKVGVRKPISGTFSF